MTIEEMIEFVKESDSNGWRSDAVVAALRAGQEMRDMLRLVSNYQDSFDGVEVINHLILAIWVEAWDEATKEAEK